MPRGRDCFGKGGRAEKMPDQAHAVSDRVRENLQFLKLGLEVRIFCPFSLVWNALIIENQSRYHKSPVRISMPLVLDVAILSREAWCVTYSSRDCSSSNGLAWKGGHIV